ncbi:hypothetical protein LzC2_42640 [Planctomycetes bacterium LzC2]|uniref:Uncharacterized protein n=1 Tax=Alienimonas chondri TaxID=2681879 RepID=A0ABX1VJ35_9PLAN|nr:hypothetical protein [Alienimonas chondri]
MPAETTRAKMKANTANPSTIAAGAADRPNTSGLLLLATIAEAQHRPWYIALNSSTTPHRMPTANSPPDASTVTGRFSENITTIP